MAGASESRRAATPPPPPSVWPGPRRLAFLATISAAAAGVYLRAYSPSGAPGLYAPCLWQVATGTHCPGCGITRALHALLHGRVLAALDYNAVGLLVLTITVGVLARPGWVALRHDHWAPPVLPRQTAFWLLAGGVLWAVLRNLPWAPFTVLAP